MTTISKMCSYNINIDVDMPKGYRFVPKDDQLVKSYLYQKVNRKPVPPRVIREMHVDDFYSDPPSFYGDRARDERGFFFLIFDEPYSIGDFTRSRTVGNGMGTWKPEKRYEVAISDGNGKIIGYKNEKWVLGRLVQHKRANSSYGTCSVDFYSGLSRVADPVILSGREEESEEYLGNISGSSRVDNHVILSEREEESKEYLANISGSILSGREEESEEDSTNISGSSKAANHVMHTGKRGRKRRGSG